MRSKYAGTWRITEMEDWDADYINVAGRGHLRIDQDGGGFMRFGAVTAALDCRVEDTDSNQKLERRTAHPREGLVHGFAL